MLKRKAASQVATIALDPLVVSAVRAGANVIFNLSGGKDSGASALATTQWLDAIGHPRERRMAIHSDLGQIEWRSTLDIVRQVADAAGVPLLVVSRRAGGLIERWRQRFSSGKARYEALETYHLIGPFSSSALRFCTSELKAQVIGSEIARRFRGQTTISVLGLRRDESAARASISIAKQDYRFASAGNRARTNMLTWNPIADWSAFDTFALHERLQLPLHEAYLRYGATRLGCSFCVLASLESLIASTRADDNIATLAELTMLEATSTFSFQPSRWLGDVAPDLLTGDIRQALLIGKVRALERRSLEMALPRDLRFTRGYPPRIPTLGEAARIATTRAAILAHHDLPNHFPTASAVIDRFAELHRKHGNAPSPSICS